MQHILQSNDLPIAVYSSGHVLVGLQYVPPIAPHEFDAIEPTDGCKHSRVSGVVSQFEKPRRTAGVHVVPLTSSHLCVSQ